MVWVENPWLTQLHKKSARMEYRFEDHERRLRRRIRTRVLFGVSNPPLFEQAVRASNRTRAEMVDLLFTPSTIRRLNRDPIEGELVPQTAEGIFGPVKFAWKHYYAAVRMKR